MVTEMAMGKTLDEAKKITKKSVAESLDGLPKEKLPPAVERLRSLSPIWGKEIPEYEEDVCH
jgi:NifU-like protein involved in Fe-S cluster formation